MRTPRCLTPDRIFFSVVVLLISLGGLSCRHKPELLIDRTKTLDSDITPLHIAYLKIKPDDKRHYNLESCFVSEPGIEFYNTPETYRIFRERNISAADVADSRSLKRFAAMNDFDLLLISLPRGKTVLLRSFRFREQRFVESFAPTTTFKCESIYSWLNLVKIVSFPDNAYTFVDKRYVGRTPRWIHLNPGEYRLRVEKFEGVIGEQVIEVPGTTEVLIKSADSEDAKVDDFGEIRSTKDKVGIGLTAVVAAAVAIVGALIPILLLL